MGPLVPDIISSELSLIIALLIGIAFGFLLEQAGFSSAKKLVGLFYGYDFTVLRVFFTAGITTMVGIIIFDHFHLIDLNIIYINPLYIWPAIVGGLIMGLGFVVGGYCPGTSICAAAIGKKDAMFFIIGAAIGVFIFIEGYPIFEGLFNSGFYGSPQLSDTFGLPNAVFAFLFILIAISAFAFAMKIELKVGGKVMSNTSQKYLITLAVVAFVIGAAEIFVPTHEEHIEKINSITDFSNYSFDEITSDELAVRLMYNDKSMRFIDVRSEAEFKEFALPNALLANYNNFIDRRWEDIFRVKGQVTVIYAEDEATEKRAVLAAEDVGFKNILILKGGLKTFRENILNFEMPAGPIEKSMHDTYRFRQTASLKLPKIIEDAKPKVVKKKKTKRVLGGC